MEAKLMAKNIFEESWQYAASSGATRDALALTIAKWAVSKIIVECGASVNADYFKDVLNHLNPSIYSE